MPVCWIKATRKNVSTIAFRIVGRNCNSPTHRCGLKTPGKIDQSPEGAAECGSSCGLRNWAVLPKSGALEEALEEHISTQRGRDMSLEIDFDLHISIQTFESQTKNTERNSSIILLFLTGCKETYFGDAGGSWAIWHEGNKDTSL